MSPVKEELLKHTEEQCSVSPFGLRRNFPANPEERPIHPGVKEKEKTFEDFVDEQLKLDKEPLRKDMQIRTGATGTEKRNFLRKGEGRSRLKKSMKSNQEEPPVFVLQHNEKSRRMCSSPGTHQRRSSALLDSLKTKAESKPSEQRSEITDKEGCLRNSIYSCDKKELGYDGVLQSNNENQTPCFARASDHVDGSNSQKNKEHPKESNQKCHLHRNRPSQSGNILSSNSDLKVGSLEERVSFKRVNDRIIRVPERRAHSPSGMAGRTEQSADGLTLTTEIMQLWHRSDSSDSTSTEEDPVSQYHRLPKLPSNPSRLDCRDNDNVDLSDEDYASDALSDTRDGVPGRIRTPHCPLAQLSSSAGSGSESSESEIQRLHWSQTDRVKEAPRAEGRRATETKDELRTPGTSDLFSQVFPQVTCPGENRADNECSVRSFNSQHCNSGKPLQKIQGRSGLGVRTGGRSDITIDKMKTEQDKALTFIRLCGILPFVLNTLVFEDLKQQIQYIKKHLAEREREWWQAHSELQSRVDVLTRENQVLLSQCALSERLRNSTGRSTPHPAAQGMLNPDITNDGTQALRASKAIIREEICHPDGRIEQFLSNGSRVIVFRNGTTKEIGADQKSVTVSFFNGDVKRIQPDGTVVYHYYDAQITHSTYPSGLEVLQFPNNQREKRYPDGTREIVFPDGTIKSIPEGRQKTF
ncbi:hypothetical protein P4O66_009209 [Electrophorus voltai]|uniref:Centromere protein J C-terminal domain-containing protein n=1 Tax=Electrophorus voltai TaxID=2609070 RepID=A0AAD9DX50_9TELE|nr:hypothetical protein P4O66_009209 [Electrophorus voltai]